VPRFNRELTELRINHNDLDSAAIPATSNQVVEYATSLIRFVAYSCKGWAKYCFGLKVPVLEFKATLKHVVSL
jgi:hypothetical protein